MSRIFQSLLIIAGFMVGMPAASRAAENGTIVGRILERDGTPADFVTVLILGTSLGAMTDTDGLFRIQNVPASRQCDVKILKMGFRTTTTTVWVLPNRETQVDFTLEEGIRTEIKPIPSGLTPTLLPISLIESWPVETFLDHPDIPDAADAWLYLIKSSRTSLDFAEFYASDDPKGGGRLKPIVEAIEEAANRGVKVRFLAEQSFYKTYPEIIDRLAKTRNITVRRLNSKAFDGGVLHAKYFIKDGMVSVIGSQNFDWRALDHIQELGVIVDDAYFTAQLMDVFDLDWEIAGVVPVDAAPGTLTARADSVAATRRRKTGVPKQTGYERYEFAASPSGRLPDDRTWDEPKLVAMIDAAKESLQVQLLTYRPVDRDGAYYEVLENALRRAAARGVTVRLLLADWCKRKPTIDYLKSLALFPGIEIRLMTIPQWSGGFVPFSRVCHAKYLIVDGEHFWIGTSNWERDYFHSSRNVGVVGASRHLGDQLNEFFRTGWASPYAERIRAEVDYVPPRISD